MHSCSKIKLDLQFYITTNIYILEPNKGAHKSIGELSCH